ncbi:MAG: hypothetical protein ACR2PK_04600 [Acidimicrobiales bacterium]
MDVEEFVESCRAALTETQPQLAVRDLVAEQVSDPAAITAALGEPTSWALDALHHSDDLTILHIIWPPDADLFAHDHQMWATIGLYGGREDNAIYRRSGDALELSGSKELLAGDVFMLGSEAIHSVHNPLKEWTGAIHVYGGDFFNAPRTEWDPETGQPRPFDADHARAVLSAADAAAKGSD